MLKIRFYAHLVFENTHDMGDMFRSVDIVVSSVELCTRIFKGKSIYVGTGEESVQYNDTVEFENLSEEHEKAILKNFPFSRKVN